MDAAESIYDGTWSSGPPPQEVADFEIMRAMKWTWAELQDTPLYVRRYVWDFINLRAKAEKAAIDKAAKDNRAPR